MKHKILSFLLVIIICNFSLFAGEQKFASDILKNAYIISKNPAGLNIGHESGVVFVPFAKMSKERQKYYKYDREKAKKHEAKISKAQRKRQVRVAKAQTATASSNFLEYPSVNFPQQSNSNILKDELASLLREKATLEKERTAINSGQISPSGGPSDQYYISYRGGKVYRNKQKSYTQQHSRNSLDKKRRLKEIDSNLQKNKRRTSTVRNLISRNTTKGIKVGKTLQ
jgi:hypothetical protein